MNTAKQSRIKEGIIFSMEEFAIHDGPGIRTTIFLKGCPLRCVWCHNPEGISPTPEYMIRKEGKVLCGYQITTKELAEIVRKNQTIYTLNNGGITLTGGEPLMQSGFVTEFLGLIPDIHKAIETSGYAPLKIFREVTDRVDLVLFDIKQMNPTLHKKFTGRDNAPILRNLDSLCASDKEFIIRIPLIPGVNDSRENMEAILDRIKDARSLVRVELLRYHQTAGAKYAMIGQTYDPPFDVTATPAIYNVFEEHQIKTIIA